MKYLALSFVCVLSSLTPLENSFGQTTLQETKTLLGKALAVTQQYGGAASGDGVNSSTNIKFAGKSIPLLNSILEFTAPNSTTNPLATAIANSSHDFYVNGVKIYSETTTNTNGDIVYTGTVPPGQLSIPVFTYTVGPLALAVNAGLSYEAAITGKLTPSLSTNLADASVAASIDTSATASGFVEGLARVMIVQAGIGGNVNILQGDATVAAQVFFQGTAPTLTYNGKLTVLGGNIYAFVDYKKLFASDWTRLKSFTLYQWPGKCWAMGTGSCTSN